MMSCWNNSAVHWSRETGCPVAVSMICHSLNGAGYPSCAVAEDLVLPPFVQATLKHNAPTTITTLNVTKIARITSSIGVFHIAFTYHRFLGMGNTATLTLLDQVVMLPDIHQLTMTEHDPDP